MKSIFIRTLLIFVLFFSGCGSDSSSGGGSSGSDPQTEVETTGPADDIADEFVEAEKVEQLCLDSTNCNLPEEVKLQFNTKLQLGDPESTCTNRSSLRTFPTGALLRIFWQATCGDSGRIRLFTTQLSLENYGVVGELEEELLADVLDIKSLQIVQTSTNLFIVGYNTSSSAVVNLAVFDSAMALSSVSQVPSSISADSFMLGTNGTDEVAVLSVNKVDYWKIEARFVKYDISSGSFGTEVTLPNVSNRGSNAYAWGVFWLTDFYIVRYQNKIAKISDNGQVPCQLTTSKYTGHDLRRYLETFYLIGSTVRLLNTEDLSLGPELITNFDGGISVSPSYLMRTRFSTDERMNLSVYLDKFVPNEGVYRKLHTPIPVGNNSYIQSYGYGLVGERLFVLFSDSSNGLQMWISDEKAPGR